MNDTDEIVQDFLIESHEGLDRLDSDLLDLEQNPDCLETLARIFRTIHTIKGTCSFLGFSRLERVAHVGENLLSLMRDRALARNPQRITALLQLVDAIREMLAAIEATGMECDDDYLSLIATLHQLQEADAATATATLALQRVSGSPEGTRDGAAEPAKTRAGHLRETATIRVRVGLLDQLMQLADDLSVVRNEIVDSTKAIDDPSVQTWARDLDRITTELQEGVLKTRMQPIGSIWTKFPRVVRDLALICQKEVTITMIGAETELDRTLIEAIKDPLTHILRNSIDHGIEAPERRQQLGKPRTGQLELKARHEADSVIIEISDDGVGIDPQKLQKKVREQGLMAASELDRLTNEELCKLIFLAGVSTAERVTNLSGRGVGMDVVKTNIEKIGGTVELDSRPGHGTTLRVKVPCHRSLAPARPH